MFCIEICKCFVKGMYQVIIQMNGMTVDAPSGSVVLDSKKGQIFFVTEVRDWSCGFTVAFPEKSALELQDCTKAEFEERASQGALSFQRCNLRVVRSINKGFVSMLAMEVFRVEQFSPMTETAKKEYACQLDVTGGRQSGSVVPCPLYDIQTNALEGFDVAKQSCTKIVVLVKGTATSDMEILPDSKRKIITSVTCQLVPAETLHKTIRVCGYCLEKFVSFFMIGKQNAYVLVTQIDEQDNHIDLIAEHVQIVPVDEVVNIRETLQAELHMLALDETSVIKAETSVIRAKRNLDSPQALLTDSLTDLVKKSRTIAGWPSDTPVAPQLPSPVAPQVP